MDYIKLGIVIVILVMLIRMKLAVGLALIVAAGCVIIAYTIDPHRAFDIALTTITSGKNLTLIGAVILIYTLINCMNHTGKIESLTRFTGESKFALIFPAMIIGLVPMPGGAIISAPMVDELAEKMKLSPEKKVYVNYWFRHMWEFGWPMYPAIILLAEILGVSYGDLFFSMAGILVLMFCIGYIAVLRHIPFPFFQKNIHISGILSVIYPIIVVIVAVLIKLPVVPVLAVVIIFYTLYEKIKIKALWKAFHTAVSFKTLLLIYGALLLKETISAVTFTDAVSSSLGLLFLVLVLLPFGLGFASGLTITGIGTAIPIAMVLLGENMSIWHGVLVYTASVCGILVSPAHLCLTLSVDFFKAHLKSVYTRYLIPSTLPIFLVAVVIFFVRTIMVTGL